MEDKNFYNFQQIEKHWQEEWATSGMFSAKDKVAGKKNFYSLVMFPYPSGNLHIGHWYNYVPADVFNRFNIMQGVNLMSPIGFDAFGLPAENAAIKRGIHPRDWTHDNIGTMREQLKSIGAVYDWQREVITCEPEYYKWTQWMFLALYNNGLAYKGMVPANWCPSCKTVLANEQVVDGKCERCGFQVEQREIEQWLFRISAFAENLLDGLDGLDWPETTKIMQKNWIGKSEGWELSFALKADNFDLGENLQVFTTRADTLFGATYVVAAPEHELVSKFRIHIKNLKLVEQYIKDSKNKTELERISDLKEKTGIELKGIKAVNPVNGREVPIFLADYVLSHYGTGAIMAVPAHDQRDFDFSKEYNLPVIEVIRPEADNNNFNFSKAFEGDGLLINSEKFDGMKSGDAKDRIGEWLSKKKLAQKRTYYRIKDWLVSRQRYWGSPIPMISCQKCGWVPVPEEELPVLLPEIEDFKPTEDGKSPLAKSKKFLEAACPKCGGPAQRETDTLDTFVCSSWYYLRYSDPKNGNVFASKEKLKNWLPVNMYIGGAEHAILHLLYARFFTKALHKLGYLDFNEPFSSLRHQGIILGEDGQKMSKSRGNVVDPGEQVRLHGSDAVRLYLCFMGPFSQGGPWNPSGMEGASRFLKKIFGLAEFNAGFSAKKSSLPAENPGLEKLFHKTVKKVTEDIENFRFNTAISALMILINQITADGKILSENHLKTLILLLSPFAPHLSEELWQKYVLKSSVFEAESSVLNQSWPKYDKKLIEERMVQLIIQINGKMRDKIEVEADIKEEDVSRLTLGQEKVKRWLEGKEVKKVIFIPGKLINIVI